jgi:hypothetical protein
MHRLFGRAKPAAPAEPPPDLNAHVASLEAKGGEIDKKIASCDAELLGLKQARTRARGARCRACSREAARILRRLGRATRARLARHCSRPAPPALARAAARGPARPQALAKARTPAAQAPLKSKALAVLRRRNMYAAQREQMTQRAFNIEQTAFAVDSMKEAKEHVAAMKASTAALKEGTAAFDLSEVEDLADDMADMMAEVGDVNEILSRPMDTYETVDEADLDAALAGLDDDLGVGDAVADGVGVGAGAAAAAAAAPAPAPAPAVAAGAGAGAGAAAYDEYSGLLPSAPVYPAAAAAAPAPAPQPARTPAAASGVRY